MRGMTISYRDFWEEIFSRPVIFWLSADSKERASLAVASLKNIKVGRCLEFEQEPLAAVLWWLQRPRKGWRNYILSDTPVAEFSRGVLETLAYHTQMQRYDAAQNSALTLIARRLMWIAGAGVIGLAKGTTLAPDRGEGRHRGLPARLQPSPAP